MASLVSSRESRLLRASATHMSTMATNPDVGSDANRPWNQCLHLLVQSLQWRQEQFVQPVGQVMLKLRSINEVVGDDAPVSSGSTACGDPTMNRSIGDKRVPSPREQLRPAQQVRHSNQTSQPKDRAAESDYDTGSWKTNKKGSVLGPAWQRGQCSNCPWSSQGTHQCDKCLGQKHGGGQCKKDPKPPGRHCEKRGSTAGSNNFDGKGGGKR